MATTKDELLPSSSVDPRVAEMSMRLRASPANKAKSHDNNDTARDDGSDIDDDELLEELEKDDDLAGFREQRLEELKREMVRLRELRQSEHGRYIEMTDEKEVIKASAKEERCVIHFYHRDFRRCKIMDKHLEAIAPRYIDTRFLRVLVENVPWLVERLSIKVLPCVICFIKGVTKDRVVGFEDLGNGDEFQTSALELRLRQSGVISAPPPSTGPRPMYSASSRIRGPSRDNDDDDDDFDE